MVGVGGGGRRREGRGKTQLIDSPRAMLWVAVVSGRAHVREGKGRDGRVIVVASIAASIATVVVSTASIATSIATSIVASMTADVVILRLAHTLRRIRLLTKAFLVVPRA